MNTDHTPAPHAAATIIWELGPDDVSESSQDQVSLTVSQALAHVAAAFTVPILPGDDYVSLSAQTGVPGTFPLIQQLASPTPLYAHLSLHPISDTTPVHACGHIVGYTDWICGTAQARPGGTHWQIQTMLTAAWTLTANQHADPIATQAAAPSVSATIMTVPLSLTLHDNAWHLATLQETDVLRVIQQQLCSVGEQEVMAYFTQQGEQVSVSAEPPNSMLSQCTFSMTLDASSTTVVTSMGRYRYAHGVLYAADPQAHDLIPALPQA